MILIKTKFEIFYDKYSSMAYDIAIQIAPDVKQADEILNATFTNAYYQNIEEQSFPPPFISLIKILIATAEKLLNFKINKNSFRLKQFEDFPVLQSLVCENVPISIHCIKNKITGEQAAINLRAEVLLLIKLQDQNNLISS